MAQQLDPNDLVTFKEPLMVNSIQNDAIVQLLIEEGIITQEKFFTKLKQVQAQYQSNEK
jgi:hypothetical protein